jgi:DNA primase
MDQRSWQAAFGGAAAQSNVSGVALIKQSSVEQVKAAADIVDVIGERTQLRKSGSRFTGRCPFHEERTPSFSVNPVEKFYKCFGCGVGGDVITFVRETQNLDFAGAIEWLADRFRVPLEYEESSPEADRARERRKRLLALLEQAAAFYARYLWESPAGEAARSYLAERGLSEEVCREFQIGFAPGGPTLVRKAREKGFSNDELLAAGLANRRGNDYFSHRIVFPLADARGRVLGFQARKLRDDDPIQAKYVNSPESELFQKGAILYGLDRARAPITKEDRAIVVEGNTDVLALRQAGLEPVVASMGTALTERQLVELSRLSRNVWLCFDGDAAGEAATLRGMELAAKQNLAVKVVTLPRGLDPADDPAGFEQRLATAEHYLVYRTRLEVERAPDRDAAWMRVREFLTPFPESPARQDAVRLAADRLDLAPELQAGLAPRARGSLVQALSPKVLERGDRHERSVLAAALAHKRLLPLLAELSLDHFDSEQHRELARCIVAGREPAEELVPLYADLRLRAEAEGIDEETGKELILRLRERKLERDLAAQPEREDLRAQLVRVRTAVSELV